MTNQTRVSPHGGALREGVVSEGTLRTQDLLRAFADEYERLLPFNSRSLVNEAREYVEKLSVEGVSDIVECEAQMILLRFFGTLNDLAETAGLYFGPTEGDGACFGFWKVEAEDTDA